MYLYLPPVHAHVTDTLVHVHVYVLLKCQGTAFVQNEAALLNLITVQYACGVTTYMYIKQYTTSSRQ